MAGQLTSGVAILRGDNGPRSPPHLKPWLPVPSSKDNNSSYICAQAPNYSNDDLTFLSQSAKA